MVLCEVCEKWADERPIGSADVWLWHTIATVWPQLTKSQVSEVVVEVASKANDLITT